MVSQGVCMCVVLWLSGFSAYLVPQVTPGLGLVAVVLIVLLVREPPRGHSEHHRSGKGVRAESGVKGYLQDVWYLIRM